MRDVPGCDYAVPQGPSPGRVGQVAVAARNRRGCGVTQPVEREKGTEASFEVREDGSVAYFTDDVGVVDAEKARVAVPREVGTPNSEGGGS